MNDHNDSTDDLLMMQVRETFGRMTVPPPPARSDTCEFLWRELQNTDRELPGPPAPLPPSQFTGRRIVLAASGLSAAAAAVLVLLTLGSGGRLSAMERMAVRLRDVESYRYTLTSTTTQTDAHTKRTTTWTERTHAFWSAPDAFRDETKIVKSEQGVDPGDRHEEILEEFAQIFPPGRPGIFIDRKRKTYFLQPYDPIGSRTYPLEMLKLIREDSPPVLRELGTKHIGEKQTRGYVVPLTTGFPPRRHEVEVWVDAQTDLPVEFGYQVRGKTAESPTTVLRVGDFHWNEPLDAKDFEPTPPEGYLEKPPAAP